MRLFDFNGSRTPTPSPGWAVEIGRRLRVAFGPAPTPLSPDTTATSDARSVTELMVGPSSSPFSDCQVYDDRMRVIKDIDQMDRQDELINTGFDIIADHATGYENEARNGKSDASERTSGFHVVCNDAGAQKVLDALVIRLGLDDEIWQIVRRTIKYGFYAPEVVVDQVDHLSIDDKGELVKAKKNRIASLDETAANAIWPKINSKGRKVPGWLYRVNGQKQPKEMEEWQICPFFFGPRTGFFSQPLLFCARYNWKRLQKIEDDLAAARLRGHDRLIHHVPVSKSSTRPEVWETIKTYIGLASKRKTVGADGTINQQESPLDVAVDFYLPDDGENKGDVKILASGNAHLTNLNDIYYHRERLIVRMGVPMGYYQIMSTQKTHLTAGSGLTGIDKQFAKTLIRAQQSLRRGLRRLFDMELAFNGYNPKTTTYSIELPRIATRDMMLESKTLLTYAQAAVYFNEAFGALPPELVADKFMDLTTEQRAIMGTFIDKWGDRVIKARIKALELAATAQPGIKDRLPGDNTGGSGNNNKSRAERSTEQKGAAQSISVDSAAALFADFAQRIEDDLSAQGVDIPSMDGRSVESITADLLEIAEQELAFS